MGQQRATLMLEKIGAIENSTCVQLLTYKFERVLIYSVNHWLLSTCHVYAAPGHTNMDKMDMVSVLIE